MTELALDYTAQLSDRNPREGIAWGQGAEAHAPTQSYSLPLGTLVATDLEEGQCPPAHTKGQRAEAVV